MSKSKKKPHVEKPRAKSAPPSSEASPRKEGGEPASPQQRPKDGLRETFESIVVAFVLAFLFRGFEAEAFVIPTGSMAPTLYGRHKDLTCEKCKFHFTVGASDEVDNDGYLEPQFRLRTTICPNCRYEMDIKDVPVFKGDRILVNKFHFEAMDPRRWDVTVFKYPEEPQTNYIKRLVGLPGETLMIKRGDLYTKGADGKWSILRKDDPNKQRSIQITLYDNDHPETELHKQGWPRRWVPVEKAPSENAIAGWSETKSSWVLQPETNSFELELDKSSGKPNWIRYRNIVPTPDDWKAIDPNAAADEFFKPELNNDPKPELITDFCGYNAYTGGNDGRLFRDYYWVNDITVAFSAEIKEVGDQPTLVVELNEGVRRFRCRFDVSTGKASLLRLEHDEEQVLATADTDVKGTGNYQIRFANVDNRLCLWVDSDLVDFGPVSEYELTEVDNPSPQEEDLIPIGVAATDAGINISHLVIQRDLYYRSEHVSNNDDYGEFPGSRPETLSKERLRSLLTSPLDWYEHYHSGMKSAVFDLAEDEYMMLGDNSPRSKDSRLWTNTRKSPHRHAVKRSALVGKAFYIYWPHGVPFMNDGNGYAVPMLYHKKRHFDGQRVVRESTDYPDWRLPFYPQFNRMQRIR